MFWREKETLWCRITRRSNQLDLLLTRSREVRGKSVEKRIEEWESAQETKKSSVRLEKIQEILSYENQEKKLGK